jgi:DNA-binding HxlR family transcriptional regulator
MHSGKKSLHFAMLRRPSREVSTLVLARNVQKLEDNNP